VEGLLLKDLDPKLIAGSLSMNSLDAFEKRLRDETATVEREIQLHNQTTRSVKATTARTRRAGELLESYETARSSCCSTLAQLGGLQSLGRCQLPLLQDRNQRN